MKTLKSIKLAILGIFLLSISAIHSQVVTIGSTGDYPTLSAASAYINAGDSVIVQNETFSNGSQYLNIAGTAADPIVIIAETEYGAIFQGGSQAIHLVSSEFVELNGFIFEQQTANGVNIDDGGDYDGSANHITIRNCIFRDMAGSGNNDLLKMSGVYDFLIEDCDFIDGAGGGSGIDFVGCHNGTIQDCNFDNAGSSGIQNKGGTQYITIQRNVFKNMVQRALNLGGSTGLQYFRPPLPDPIVDAFEAADINVFSNIFIGTWSPIAFVGCVRVKVFNNTIYKPEHWVIRILQETTEPGFLPCGDNEFRNNIIYQETDLTEVNVGNNTAPATFVFSNNLWYNETSSSWSPVLPVVDTDQVIGDPLFVDDSNEDFMLMVTSPAIEAGKVLATPTTDFINVNFYNPPSSGAYEGKQTAMAIEALEPLQAKLVNDLIQLQWSTKSEVNNNGFEIQRSNNGIDWSDIGWVDGRGNSSSGNQYQFMDKSPINGRNYYRYKQVDHDGKFSYSDIINIEYRFIKTHIFPNPSTDFISIRTSKNGFNDNVLILDYSGQVALKAKTNNGILDISTIKNGMYLLVIEQGVNLEYHRLVIVE